MSKCSRELDPVFDEIAENALLRDLADYGTPEWKEREEKAKVLFQRANSIFLHYNPDFRPDKRVKNRRK